VMGGAGEYEAGSARHIRISGENRDASQKRRLTPLKKASDPF
jgi:hypothetical protein